MKFSIVLSVQPTRFAAATFKGDFEENLAHIAELGYDGVELAIRDPDEMDADALINLIDKYNLKVPAIGTGQAWGEENLSYTDPDPDVRQAAIARTLSHIPFAARVEAQIIIGLLRGVVQSGVSYEQAMRWLVEALRQVTAPAAEQGVRLCLEPLNRYETGLIHTVADGLELLSQVGAANLGLLLDTFHMNIEERDFATAIHEAGDRCFHFHVADSNRWYPGAGHIDFGYVLKVLEESGYAEAKAATGYVTGEFLPKPDAKTAAAKAIQHLREVAPK
jgi:sugar phosphate isomerase/epimerase